MWRVSPGLIDAAVFVLAVDLRANPRGAARFDRQGHGARARLARARGRRRRIALAVPPTAARSRGRQRFRTLAGQRPPQRGHDGQRAGGGEEADERPRRSRRAGASSSASSPNRREGGVTRGVPSESAGSSARYPARARCRLVMPTRLEAGEEVAAGRGVERERCGWRRLDVGRQHGSAIGRRRRRERIGASRNSVRSSESRSVSNDKGSKPGARRRRRFACGASRVVSSSVPRRRASVGMGRSRVWKSSDGERAIEAQLVYGSFVARLVAGARRRLEGCRRPERRSSAGGASCHSAGRDRWRDRIAGWSPRQHGRRFGAERLDFRAGLVEHAAHALARLEHHVARDVELSLDALLGAGAIGLGEQGGERRQRQPRRVGGLDGGVELRREHQQFAAGLDDDAPHVAAGRGHDLQRLALGRLPNLLAHAHELVGLGQPGGALLTVMIEQAGHPGEVGPGRFRGVLIGHDWEKGCPRTRSRASQILLWAGRALTDLQGATKRRGRPEPEPPAPIPTGFSGEGAVRGCGC